MTVNVLRANDVGQDEMGQLPVFIGAQIQGENKNAWPSCVNTKGFVSNSKEGSLMIIE